MKKIIPSCIAVILILTTNAYSLCTDDCMKTLANYIESLNSISPGLCNECGTNPPSVVTQYVIIGQFCGPNSQTEAYNAVHAMGTAAQVNKGSLCSCASIADAGYYQHLETSVTYGSCYYGIDPIRKCDYSETLKIYSVALWVKTGACELPEDDKYCALKAYSCSDGSPIGMEYWKCDIEGIPSARGFCGNTEAVASLEAGGIDGTIQIKDTCSCNLTLEDIQYACSLIDNNNDCGDCSQRDTDNDGVNDCDDHCPDTTAGATVGELGCYPNDDDGDGVSNDWDFCPNTDMGAEVDRNGCPIDTEDTDNDGVEDEYDSCPNEGGTVGPDGCPIDDPGPDADDDGVTDSEDNCPNDGGTVGPDGCPIDNPQPPPDSDGGDQDNDNPLLEGVISWLKKISGNTDQTNDKLKEIKTQLVNVNEKLDASDVPTDLPADDEFDGEIPDDYETIDLEEDFMTEFLGQLVENNAFIQQITGSTLTASGSCSLSSSASIFGHSVSLEFSICGYDLSAFRAVILMISTLTAFFIVFRKG